MNILKYFKKKENSKDTAKDRLKLVLINDRCNIPQDVLEAMKMEIIEVISKYVEIDKEEIEMKIASDRSNGKTSSALVANVPMLKIKKKD